MSKSNRAREARSTRESRDAQECSFRRRRRHRRRPGRRVLSQLVICAIAHRCIGYHDYHEEPSQRAVRRLLSQRPELGCACPCSENRFPLFRDMRAWMAHVLVRRTGSRFSGTFASHDKRKAASVPSRSEASFVPDQFSRKSDRYNKTKIINAFVISNRSTNPLSVA